MTAERCPSRLKEHDWKSCRRATVSRVRIPPSPPSTPCRLTQRPLAILPLTILLPLALLLLVLPIFLAACGGSDSSDLTGADGAAKEIRSLLARANNLGKSSTPDAVKEAAVHVEKLGIPSADPEKARPVLEQMVKDLKPLLDVEIGSG